MSAYSNERLLFGALASTFIAAAFPTLWLIAFPAPHPDLFVLASWTVLSVLALVIGAIASFLVMWPAALILETVRFPTFLGVVLIGSLAWPLLLVGILAATSGLGADLPKLVLGGMALGLACATAFATVAGARVGAPRA